MNKLNELLCTLCSLPVGPHPIVEEQNPFCCVGCHAVHRILFTQGIAEDFAKHPLFEQAVRAGLISNPRLLEEINSRRQTPPLEEMRRWHLEVLDMWCPTCAAVIQWILLREQGVVKCVVDYTVDLATIEYTPRYISKEQIAALIENLGYRVNTFETPEKKAISRQLYLRAIVAGFCALNIMMLAYPVYASYFDIEDLGYSELFAWLSFALSLPVLFYSGWPIWQRCWNGIRARILGMEVLVAMGVWAAFGLSCYELFHGSQQIYFDSMAVIIAFVLAGKIVEGKAKFSAKETLNHLTRSLPKRGRKKMPDGTYRFVPLKELQIGDWLAVFTGEKIVIDGIVKEGVGQCDESFITGESFPVMKQTGDRVLGGSILVQGNLSVEMITANESSTVHKIIEMVQGGIANKTTYQRPVDKIIKWFVPFVVAIAIITGLWGFGTDNPHEAMMRAIAVLLIACPCAIGIAAPLAESHLLNSLASMGVLIKNLGVLKDLGNETVFVFDKTGTVTEGKFEVVEGLTTLEPDYQAILKSMTLQSVHPIALAVAKAVSEDPIRLCQMEEIIGKGIRARIKETTYFFGSLSFMSHLQIPAPCAENSSQILTPIYFADEKRLIAILWLGDCIRQEIPLLLEALKPAKSVLLSGDQILAVQNVAKLCRFDAWEAECSPLYKKEYIENLRLQGHVVCFVGDGINDAPALTAASIGISVVSASDISIHVSDVLMTTDKLSIIEKLRLKAQIGRKIIKQNLFWAFFYNILGIPLACFGLMTPIYAAAVMIISSIIVLTNAERLKVKI